MGDFVKGALDHRFTPAVTAGIVRHRRTDAFAHSEPSFRRSRNRIDPRFGHFRGVMVDIFYDHFMARDWEQYHRTSLPVFAREIYRLLRERQAVMPVAMRSMAERMIANDWLNSYRDPEIVGLVLGRIGRRVRRENRLAEGLPELETNYAGLQADFKSFLRAASRYLADEDVNNVLKENNESSE